MNTSQLIIAAIVLTILILVPLIVIVLVRWLVPLEDPIDDMSDFPEPELPTNNLKDFWSALAPHLIELRDRLVKAALAIAIGTSLGFYLVNSPKLLGVSLPDFMVKQLAPPGTVLQAVGVGEVFLGYMQIALIIGIILAMRSFRRAYSTTKNAWCILQSRLSPSFFWQGYRSGGFSPYQPHCSFYYNTDKPQTLVPYQPRIVSFRPSPRCYSGMVSSSNSPSSQP